MDFVIGLPRTPGGYDWIWVIVEHLTKSAHLLPMKQTDSIEKLTQLYLKEIICRHGRNLFWKTYEADSMLYRTFKILARIGPMAYKLSLPDGLQGIHNPFHVANLKRCLSDENLIISLDEIQLNDKLHFIEEPVEIIDHEVKQLKQSRIPIVKVHWNSRRGPEFTWECKDQFKSKYLHLFTSKSMMNKAK
nr:putative reverse transcriptase domain-containing protein [Tanacetum cinerariifolium]